MGTLAGTAGSLILPARRRVLADDAAGVAVLEGTTKWFAVAIVFVTGWYLCLPETDFIQVPWWAKKFAIGPNILVHEVLFAIYLAAGGFRILVRRVVSEGYAMLPVAVCFVILATWTGVTSLGAPYPLQDAGRSARLIMMAMMVLTVAHWSAANPLLILRTFMLALVGGSIANLVLTFQNPVIMVAGLVPRLLGQNSPGPPMGIAVGLAAWLILMSRRRGDTIFAMVVAVVCAAGALISYSKTGMGAGLMGIASIGVVFGKVAPTRRGKLLVVTFLLLFFAAGLYLSGETGRRVRTGLSLMLDEKLASARPGESVSVGERWSYVIGVAEIVWQNPMGVGYSGFREAMMKTNAFRSGYAPDEANIPADESNPHSLFLHYLSAGGIVGGAVAIAAFLLLCRAIYVGLAPYGKSGMLVAGFAAVAYLVLAVSVTYLFATGVMLVPASIAAGGGAHIRRRSSDAVAS